MITIEFADDALQDWSAPEFAFSALEGVTVRVERVEQEPVTGEILGAGWDDFREASCLFLKLLDSNEAASIPLEDHMKVVYL